jgi:SpoVK/Ycf46/Vps4 family AAA+-type ATPase
MDLDSYKRDILRTQYEELIEKSEEARQNGRLEKAAGGYRKAADRLRKLEQIDDTDYSGRINDLETAADRASDGVDPGVSSSEADKPDDEDGSNSRTGSGESGGSSGAATENDEDYKERVESFIASTDLTWEDIGGLDHVQERLKQAITLGAVENAPAAVAATDRVLMFGPPGTGKTLLASAVAGSLDATFFDVKLGGLLSKYFGESSKQITALFELAAEMSPSVVFLDEIDALTQSRDDNSDQSSRRVLNTLLSELDGINKGGDDFVMVLGATNKPGDLDNAVRRRFPERLLIPLPGVDAAEEIVKIHTTKGGVSFGEASPSQFVPNDWATSQASTPPQALATACVEAGFTGSDIEALCRRAVDAMVQRSNPDLVAVADRGLDGARQYDLSITPLEPQDFRTAFNRTSASLSSQEIARYTDWNQQYGTGPTSRNQ